MAFTEPLLHQRRHLLPYLLPEEYYKDELWPKVPEMPPAAQYLRRLESPTCRMWPQPAAAAAGAASDAAFAGNAMCCLDGGHVLHAHGEDLDAVALRSIDEDAGQPSVALWQLPGRSRVQQLTAETAWGSGSSSDLVVARTKHSVHFAAAEAAEGEAGRRLREVGAASFRDGRRPRHACVSPCIRGDVAVLVAGSGLQMLKVDRSGGGAAAAAAEAAAEAAPVARPYQRVAAPWQGEEEAACWAGVEWSEHPRCLHGSRCKGPPTPS